MRPQTAASLLSALAVTGASAQAGDPVTGTLGDATVTTDNPAGVVYTAVLPATAFFADAFPAGGNIQGGVSAVASPGGTGVLFAVSFSNLPEGGPFIYHIHDKPVPADGNCTAAAGHLDPFGRGEDPPCDPARPETCQVGDLSGKHGGVPAGQASFGQGYVDPYVSTLEGAAASLAGRSVVVHFANKTRITCANFAAEAAAGPGGVVVPPPPQANATAPPPTAAFPTGAVPTTAGPAPTQTFLSVSGAAPAAPGGLPALGSAALLAAAVAAMVL